MTSDLIAIESCLWVVADQLWANTGLKPAEFSTPALGLIFPRYTDKRFADVAQGLDARNLPADERDATDYQAEGIVYLPEAARFSHLLTLTGGTNPGKAIANAMSLVKREKLVLDWRDKQQAKAAVMQTLKVSMLPTKLPAAFTKEMRAEKMARAYAHVYGHYSGAGQSGYAS